MVVSLSRVEEIDALELSALDTLFLNQQPLSNNSTKLCFIVYTIGSADRKVLQAALKDRFPKLNEKKRLEFDIRYDMYDSTSLFFNFGYKKV